jgi:hypothetical protein
MLREISVRTGRSSNKSSPIVQATLMVHSPIGRCQSRATVHLPATGGSRCNCPARNEEKTMTNAVKIALIAATAAAGIATPALAQGSYSFPTYAYTHPNTGSVEQLPAPRRLYNSAVIPNSPSAVDSEWSTTGRGNVGR